VILNDVVVEMCDEEPWCDVETVCSSEAAWIHSVGMPSTVLSATDGSMDGWGDREGALVNPKGIVGANDKVGTSILLFPELSSPADDGDCDGIWDTSPTLSPSTVGELDVSDRSSTKVGLEDAPSSIVIIEGLVEWEGLTEGVIDEMPSAEVKLECWNSNSSKTVIWFEKHFIMALCWPMETIDARMN
jgi:hypothetical protein